MKLVKGSAMLIGIVLCVLLAGGLVPAKVAAQVTTADITGKVTDQNGTPAEDVEVIARNQETGNYQITYSAANGEYRLHLLPPGVYQVMARQLNFDTMTKRNIRLDIGQTSIVDFALTPKGVVEKEIVVEAEAPLIDTKKSDLSVVVQPEQIENLPLNSRNFLELAEVAPGAKVSTGGRGPVTTGALNSRFISAYIDGGDFKNDDLGGVVGTSFGFTTNIIPEDAIQEFQVITSMYKAEYATASNGIINAITKTGTNEFHGSAFGLFRAASLNSRGPFETRTIPGTGDSKPDYNRQQYGLSLGGPIIKDQTHFFFALERNAINNFNTVFTSGLHPALDGTFKSPTVENSFLGKIDNQFSNSNTMDLRLIDVSTDNTPGNFGNTRAFSNGFNLNFRLLSLLANDRWILNTNTVNELKVHYERYRKLASPNSSDPEFVYQSSNTVTGWNDVQPQTENQDKVELRDDLEYNIADWGGAHIVKGGITLTREKFVSAAAFSSGGVFTFKTDTSALPSQGSIGLGDPSTQAWNTAFGIYLQDDWSPISNLTLNLGLRWGFETNMINNNYTNPFSGDTALTNHVSSDYLGNGSRSIDMGDIAPRIGFAWDVNNDKINVVHGGFGVFYDRMIWNFPSNELQNGRYNIYNVVFSAAAPPTTDPNTLKSYVQNGIGGAGAPGVVMFPSTLPTAHTLQWTLGVSRQLSTDLAVSLDYVAVRGIDEYTTYNANYRDFSKSALGPRALTSKYGAIGLVTANGKSWYDGVDLSISRPYQGDWQMQFSYTLSWAFDTFDDPFSNYVFQSSIQKAPSVQDERHRFVLSGVVNLPAEFQLSGIATFASPRPIAVLTGTDNNKDGTTLDDFSAGGRNSDRPTGFKNWYRDIDLRVTKYFDLPGSVRLAAVAEAFNVFNWTNYLTYVATLTSKAYGTPNSSYNPRQVQLGVRAIF